MFRQRLLSSLIGIPVVLAMAWAGGLLFFLLLLTIGLLALREFYTLTGVDDRYLSCLGYVGHVVLLSLCWQFGFQVYAAGLIGFFMVLNIYWILTFPRDFHRLATLIWGKLYVTTLIGIFLLLRGLDVGFIAILTVFITIWASDGGAYLIGMTVGKRKLIPAVSPKKSLEGAIGGILFAALAMATIAPYIGTGRVSAALMGIVLSMVGQLGDLAESALKRWSNIKDSGSFLPGHGGALDRLDSLLFAAPVAYILFTTLLSRGGQ